MRVTNADSYSGGDGYSDGTFRNSDQYGCGYGYGYVHGATSYSYGHGYSYSYSNGSSVGYAHRNGNRGTHAAAYPDAEDGSDTNAASDSHTIALAATDATLIGTIQAGTREQNSRVPRL